MVRSDQESPDGSRCSEVKSEWGRFVYEVPMEVEKVKEGKKEGKAQCCCICLEDYKDGERLVKLPCKHFYHDGCFSSWTTNHARCPLCNFDLDGLAAIDAPYLQAAEKMKRAAKVLDAKGDYDGSLELLQKAVQIHETKICLRDIPKLAGIYNNIAASLEAKGSYDTAITMYSRALKILEFGSGGNENNNRIQNRKTCGVIYSNMGYACRMQGRFDQALEIYEKSLVIKEETLGRNHVSTATTLNNIGMILVELTQYDQAMGLFEEALAIYICESGIKHQSSATTQANMAITLGHKGEFEQAWELFEEAVATHEEVLGHVHPTTGRTYSKGALIMEQRRNFNEALAMYRKALEIHSALGEDLSETVSTKENINRILKMMNDTE